MRDVRAAASFITAAATSPIWRQSLPLELGTRTTARSWRFVRWVACCWLRMSNIMRGHMVQIRQKPCRKRHDNHMPSAGIIDQARDAIALAAGPRDWSDTRESWLARGARKLGMKYARARKVWYRQLEDLRASEWCAMQEKAAELRAAQQEQRDTNHELAAQILARRAAAEHEQRGAGAIGMAGEAVAEGAREGAASAVSGQGE